MTLVETLRAARALVDTPEKWWQKNGHNSGALGCTCTCAGLALTDAPTDYERERFAARRFFASTLGLDVGQLATAVFEWNDAPERTHADVLAAFDKAIEAAEAQA